MQTNKLKCSNLISDGVTLYSSVQENNEAFLSRLRKLYPCVEDVSQLPQGWSPDYKASPLGLTRDNLTCYYRGYGPRYNERELPASVRTEYHIPPSCLLYYFEIRFVSKGRDGFMGLGITTSAASLDKLPGNSKGSYGYNAADGNISKSEDRTTPYAPAFVSGDVIGCGYNLVEGKCFFTKNGLNLGKAFEDIPSDILFYPTVGMRTIGEEVYANFGQEDFVYDIEQDLRSLRKNLTSTISEYPISDFGVWQDTLHKLVQSWLIQNSYPGTADAFQRSTRIDYEDMQRTQLRNRIQQLVLNGKISEAIKLTNDLCPGLLQDNPNLLFALKCRQFIEMIGGADTDCQTSSMNNSNNHHTEASGNGASAASGQDLTKLILLGQELFDYLRQLDKLYGRNEHNEKMVLDAIGLIAFTNPESPYYSKVLDPDGREPISQLLNRSILKVEKGSNYKAPMEDVMSHLRELVNLNNAQGRWLVDELY